MASSDAHPFANLLLVSLIILGFCVFVAWYSKKNQVAMDGRGQSGDDSFLWGLSKASPSADSLDARSATHHGRLRHKQLFEAEDLEQRMTVQMTNNDLLAITPDHVGRLQTRSHGPHQMAPAVPSGSKRDRRRRRRGDNGGAFRQLADEEEDGDEHECTWSGSGSGDSEDEVDMARMRAEYYKSSDDAFCCVMHCTEMYAVCTLSPDRKHWARSWPTLWGISRTLCPPQRRRSRPN